MTNEEYYKLVENFYQEKEKYDDWEKHKKKEFYAQINNAFRADEQKIMLGNKSSHYNVTKVVSKKTTYDVTKLKDRIDNTSVRKILITEMKIVDQDALKKLFKTLNISPSKLKGVIEINYRVDEKELEQQLQLGNIKRKDIVDAINVTESEPYFKVEKIEEKSERKEMKNGR